MSWSCEVDPEAPHFEVIPSPVPYQLGVNELGFGFTMKHKSFFSRT